ncbi:shTK domain protein [Dictyocaulus viviparus]|uniref:ShTK domain protein n=1 Tax=Dictyocaulus viviparus TaxID=29172 RepID=A0A0D8X8W3_DICVI|nr:shTK domain protein [Dictyocaulus viviparus]
MAEQLEWEQSEVLHQTININASVNGVCPNGFALISTSCCPIGSVIGATTPSNVCVDFVSPVTGQSNCPAMRNYCNDVVYRLLMKEQCPLTCGFCNES